MIKIRSRSGKIHLKDDRYEGGAWTVTVCGLSIDAVETWENKGPACTCKKCAKIEREGIHEQS